jgi:hypothetical protein
MPLLKPSIFLSLLIVDHRFPTFWTQSISLFCIWNLLQLISIFCDIDVPICLCADCQIGWFYFLFSIHIDSPFILLVEKEKVGKEYVKNKEFMYQKHQWRVWHFEMTWCDINDKQDGPWIFVFILYNT